MDQAILNEITALGIENAFHIFRSVTRGKQIPNTPFTYIGGGSSRTVLVHKKKPESVFKITKWDDNLQEFKNYHKVVAEDLQYFAAVKSLVQIDKDYSILEMEFVPGNSLDEGLYDLDYALYSKIQTEYGIGDIHGGNYRVVNGKPKLIDYAQMIY